MSESAVRNEIGDGAANPRDPQVRVVPRAPAIPQKLRKVLRRGLFVLALVLIGVLGPEFADSGAMAIAPAIRLKAPGTFIEMRGIAILGTDSIGRDILSRIIVATRTSLLIGICSVTLAAIIGTTLGLMAGYLGGTFGHIVMRVVDIQMAFPWILLALSITAALGSSLSTLIIALGLSSWTSYARLSYGSALTIREREYVTGARVCGASDARILLRHVFPNALNPVVILAGLHLGQMIIAESSLSYLGLGVLPPAISWGGMIAEGRIYLGGAWWAATFPGLAIAVTVLTLGLFGDAVRDALDPRFRFD